jgi:hypothetical protein
VGLILKHVQLSVLLTASIKKIEGSCLIVWASNNKVVNPLLDMSKVAHPKNTEIFQEIKVKEY